MLGLGGLSEAIGALSGSGTVTNSGTLAAILTEGSNGGSSTFSGVIQNGTGGLGLTKIGGGILTLTGTNTYTGATTVSTGTLLINGPTGSTAAGSAVTVSGGTLGGTGTVNGTVSLVSGGKVAPGTSPGILKTGNVSFVSGSQFLVEVNGSGASNFDQLNVTGTVTLTGSTLVSSGTITSSPGQQIVLINNDGTDAVIGTFASLAEGDTVTINGTSFVLSYQGGSDANDVTLTQAGPVSYSGEGALELRRVGNSVQFVDDGTIIDSRPIASLTNPIRTITVTGGVATNDTLTVNYGSNGFFGVNVLWHGGVGTGDNDTLRVVGETFTSATHTFGANLPTTENSGSIVYVNAGGTATISYDGLEPVDMTGSVIQNLVFNLPAGGNVATLSDGSTANDGISQLSSGGTFELTNFSNPTATGSLTINGGSGNDDFVVVSVDSQFPATATLAINGGTGSDELRGTLIDTVVLSTSSSLGFSGNKPGSTTSFSGIDGSS